MYTAFTDNQVFSNDLANVTCNRIMESIDEEFTLENQYFFLTGGTAINMQNDTQNEVKVIAFGTNSQSVFDFCRTKLSERIGAKGTYSLSDQARIIYSDDIYIEIWFLDSPGTLITVGNIRQQSQKDIPNYIE